MEIKKIDIETKEENGNFRPDSFDGFIWQEHIKQVIKTAIDSSKKRQWSLGHILFSGPSGFWKTTMAHILSKQCNAWIKCVTWYAVSKASELISILNSLEPGDVLFIDEIHRLKPTVEEVLYIAMEDFMIDMVMPEWWSVRIPLNPFTLIWATTKSESLSQPLKNRFVYQFHFMEYTPSEKQSIIKKYLHSHGIKFGNELLEKISQKSDSVPRNIYNLCVKVRDYVVSKNGARMELTDDLWSDFLEHLKIEDGGITPLHRKYLEILEEYDRPMWVKAISLQMGINEKAVEEDVEPLLIKMWKIEKTAGGRVLVE